MANYFITDLWVFDPDIKYGDYITGKTVGAFKPTRGGYLPGHNSPLFPFEFKPSYSGGDTVTISVEGKDLDGIFVNAPSFVTYDTNNNLKGVIDISQPGNHMYVVFKFTISVDDQSRTLYLQCDWIQL